MAPDSPAPVDYRAILESTPVVPWELDAGSGRLSYVGPQAAALLGLPAEAWLAPSFWEEHILPDDQAAVVAARDELIRTRGSHVIEYRLEHAEGRLVWVSEAASAVACEGRTQCVRGLLVDVTERKRLQASLAQSEARLRALLRGAPDAMIFATTTGAILNINDQATYLFGYSIAEIGGSSVDLLVPERLRARMAEHRRAFEGEASRRSLVDGRSFAVQRSDGEEVPVELSISLVELAGDRQLLYAVRDLTARRRVEAKLSETERRLRGMADALPALVCYVDSDQRYRFVNGAYAAWARWDREELEGRRVREVLGESVYAEVRPSIETALAGESVHYYADVIGPTGVEHRVDVSYVPHRERGEVTGYFVVVVEASVEVESNEEVRDFRGERVGSPRRS